MIYMTHVTSCHLRVPVLLSDGVSPREYRGFESLWAADIDTRNRPITDQYSGHVTCFVQSQASIQVTWSQGKGVSRRSVGRSPGKHLLAPGQQTHGDTSSSRLQLMLWSRELSSWIQDLPSSSKLRTDLSTSSSIDPWNYKYQILRDIEASSRCLCPALCPRQAGIVMGSLNYPYYYSWFDLRSYP